MRLLNLQNNSLGDDGAVAMAKSVHKLKELELSECKIGVKGVGALVEKLKEDRSRVSS